MITATGDKIYELKNNHFTLEGDNESVLRSMYDAYYYPEDGGNETTFEEFYPYLFWEGRGLDYHRPSEGFVAARENVK